MSLWVTGETITAERINSQRADWSEDDSTSLAYIANKQLVTNEITQTQSDVGNLSNLTTSNKSSLVGAVNEVDADVSTLQTSVATNTGEITQLKSDLGDLDAIKTALLACFDGVAWAGTNGAALRQALYVALFNPYWAISATFTNCTSSNNSGSILKGEAYTATLSPNTGYTLTGATVSVTMNSVDITSQVYSNGVITIPSVTGDLVISVSAAALVVSSLSAVYTQSGTVYDTDDLDVLKDDLVVTATYNDSSTEVIPSASYTLSGTLSEGTSTVTATFGSATATFDVTVSWGYMLRTPFVSDGDNSVETGKTFAASSTFTLATEVTLDAFLSNRGVNFIWGNRKNAGNNYMALQTAYNTWSGTPYYYQMWGCGVDGISERYSYPITFRVVNVMTFTSATACSCTGYVYNATSGTTASSSKSYTNSSGFITNPICLGFNVGDTGTCGIDGTISQFIFDKREWTSDEITAFLEG